jgi:lipopolysaccharide/colanic/teichoic acid biosynthesis glycosyltransferase
MTGLWQVMARTNPSFETCMKLDLEYMKRWSLWLDFNILLRTVPAVVSGGGQ